ncbi:MAG: glycosyl hydrolase family 28-related protein [Bryobacteraceae bacterium]
MFDMTGRLTALIAGVLYLIGLTAGTAWADHHIVYVPSPNGTDDTANIQLALDTCVQQHPGGCTIQLASGTYLTRQIVVSNFRGTLKGIGIGSTVIDALPNLPVNFYFDGSNACVPNTTTCLWNTLMVFLEGDISISDLSVHMKATDGTATSPPGQIETAIRLMGQYPTNVHIDRVEMEGSPDSTSPFGFNVGNGIMYTGEINSSPNPLAAPCGAPLGFYFLSGSYTVRNSSFRFMSNGVSQDGCVRSSQVTIGGSPSTGNSFRDLNTGIDLESAENSHFEVSYNTCSGIGFGMWVIPWFSSLFLPSKPSRYSIHNNYFSTTGTYGTGIYLYNEPGYPWINASILNNAITLQNNFSDGIDVINTRGTAVINNRIAGTGYEGIGLWASSSDQVIGNNVASYRPDPSVGIAQINLDPSSNQDHVVCFSPSDTVLNQGSNNWVNGCHEIATAPKAAGKFSVPQRLLPRRKHSPFVF